MRPCRERFSADRFDTRRRSRPMSTFTRNASSAVRNYFDVLANSEILLQGVEKVTVPQNCVDRMCNFALGEETRSFPWSAARLADSFAHYSETTCRCSVEEALAAFAELVFLVSCGACPSRSSKRTKNFLMGSSCWNRNSSDFLPELDLKRSKFSHACRTGISCIWLLCYLRGHTSTLSNYV